MSAMFVAELIAAIWIAVLIVRYWKAIVACVVVVALTLTVIGAMTVVHNLS
jgi:hypothetical protein